MSDVVLMDGSHDADLKKYVGSAFDGHPLWSGRYVKENPDILRKIFQDTIQCGSEMIMTYSYQITADNLQQHYGVTREEALEIIKKSVKICKDAIELEKAKGITRPITVVGIIGPYGAYLHDGSEYAGGKYVDGMTIEELAEWHRPRFEALIEGGSDYLLFGTIPSLKEAEALITLLKEYPGMKAIVSFSAQNEKTISHGEKMSEAAQKCWELAADQILAIGVNCLHPRLAEPLLRSIKETNPNIPLFVKTNTTETFNTEIKQWEPSRDSKSLSEYCQDWLNLGVQYISGCCRTSLEDIASFREEIKKFKNKSNY